MAVKTFQDHVKLNQAKWEADVLNQFDHPGIHYIT